MDINTAKNRWFRLPHPPSRRDLPDIDYWLDLYWGGPERRITGITVRIFGMNVLALVILLLGTMFLGQFERSLVESKLEVFGTELNLVTAAVSTALVERGGEAVFDEESLREIVVHIAPGLPHRLRVYSDQGTLLIEANADSYRQSTAVIPSNSTAKDVLKSMISVVFALLPDRGKLDIYPGLYSNGLSDHPDAIRAYGGQSQANAWLSDGGKIYLSAAAPLLSNGDSRVSGVVLLTRPAADLEEEISDMWMNIFYAFVVTLVITTLLSIYLSGVIGRPLRKLAKAAESVRRGKSRSHDIPDMSDRHDEIGELSVALRAMTHALWSRMDAVEAFASDVSHELKNPLTSLKSALETAQVVKNKKDQKKLMDIMAHDIERLDRLITDISHISRLDSQLSRDVYEEISLKQVLHTLLDMYAPALERTDSARSNWRREVKHDQHEIVLMSDELGDFTVYGHEQRLLQVFQNLLGNALSFSKQGGQITIKVKQEARNQVQICFADQGPGIPEGRLEKIFERFYTERPQSESYGRHSGLGLSISRQIILTMGGDVHAENIMDDRGEIKGARFVVRLPLL